VISNIYKDFLCVFACIKLAIFGEAKYINKLNVFIHQFSEFTA
jgi:hypothetical protein